jgi:transposase
MYVADHLTLDELRARADAERDKRLFLRLRAVYLAATGLSAPEVAAALGPSRRAVQRWIARYNAEGPDALGHRPRPGQPTLLPASDVGRLRERLDAGPTPADGVCTLRAKDVRAILQAEFGVAYSLPGVYALLHRLGYSCLDPRPRHPKSDPAAREDFKKKSPA